MKRFLSLYLLISFIYLVLCPFCVADDKNMIISSAEIQNSKILIGEIDKKVLNKYVPVKVTIENKNQKLLLITDKIYYVDKKQHIYQAPDAPLIFEKTKRHTIKRAAIWGTIGLFIFTVPAATLSAAHSLMRNDSLADSIERNIFSKRYVPYNDFYSAYVFIPKKHKKARELIIRDILFDNGTPFDLKIPVRHEDLNLELNHV